MKLTRSLLALALCFSLSLLSFLALPLTTAIAQEINAALQRGYRTGYSDGYMAGYRDVIDNSSKDLSSHPEYSDASENLGHAKASSCHRTIREVFRHDPPVSFFASRVELRL